MSGPIQRCLRVCPRERIGLHQIQSHPWMCSGEGTSNDDYGNVAQLDQKIPVFCQHPPETYSINVPTNRKIAASGTICTMTKLVPQGTISIGYYLPRVLAVL